MPRKITQADVQHVWDTYKQVYGELPIPTREEAERGIKKLWRMMPAGETAQMLEEIEFKGRVVDLHRISWTNAADGGRIERFVLQVCRSASWPLIVNEICALRNGWAIDYKMARAVCTRGWLTGTLIPPTKPKTRPTKDAVRLLKIQRLEARRAAWVKKEARAYNAIKKIDRSLNALKRFA